MSKFDLFGDADVIKDLSIFSGAVFISDVMSLITGMPSSSTFVVRHGDKSVKCRVIPPNSFFTFKETSVVGNTKVNFITDMMRLCKGAKQCVFEDREGDKYPISAVNVMDGVVTLIASKTMLVVKESLVDL